MSLFAAVARTNLTRHLRSPALWFMGLAAPIGALYMVPPADAAYATLTVNGMLPHLTSSVIGLELGVVTATLLTPLAYIYLRSGATKLRPWQVTDVSPASRPLQTMGQWAADTVTLWIILTALTVAGAVLSYFRLPPDANWNPFSTALALWLPAAPALALIAAVRTFFDSRPLLRRWPGDVLFFVLWLGALMVPLIGSALAGDGFEGAPFQDPFGFAAPISGSTDVIMNGVTIIGTSESTDRISLNAMQGVLEPAYLTSRIFWFAAAIAIAGLAGLVYKPRVASSPKQAGRRAGTKSIARTHKNVPQKAMLQAFEVQPTSPLFATFISEIKLILRGRVWLIAIAAAALAGLIFPYTTVVGPVIWLALLFPLTAESGRWQSGNTRQFLGTTGIDVLPRAGLFFLAGLAIFTATHVPAIGKMAVTGTWADAPQMAAIILSVPLVATLLGTLTRGPIAGRLILLIAWYVYKSAS